MSVLEKLKQELSEPSAMAETIARLEEHGRKVQGIISIFVNDAGDDDDHAAIGNAGSSAPTCGVPSTAAEGS